MIVFTVIGVIVSAAIAAVCGFWVLSWSLAKMDLTRQHKPYIPKGVKPQTDTTNAYASQRRVSTGK